MKHTFIEVDQHVCPRGKLVQIYFVPTLPKPSTYIVVVRQDSVLMAQSEPVMKEVAYDIADIQADLPGMHGDSNWRAVLARLMGKEEFRGEWKGSNAEYASRFPVGTLDWLRALTIYRVYKILGQSAPI
jgi:hypothetical protein